MVELDDLKSVFQPVAACSSCTYCTARVTALVDTERVSEDLSLDMCKAFDTVLMTSLPLRWRGVDLVHGVLGGHELWTRSH